MCMYAFVYANFTAIRTYFVTFNAVYIIMICMSVHVYTIYCYVKIFLIVVNTLL